MASFFAHGFSAWVFTKIFKRKKPRPDWVLLILAIICSTCPDADVISFNLGIPYSSPLGHRGFTHSILFALIWGYFMAKFYFLIKSKRVFTFWVLVCFFFICTMSHGILDAMTSGGKGVGFFIPFDNSRYFFPFRPIQVSPLGIDHFFGKWGLHVIWSEFIWIGIPGILFLIMIQFFRK